MHASFIIGTVLSTVAIPPGEWVGNISGLPNAKLAQVPLLGNGYSGVAVDYWASANETTTTGPHQQGAVDFWVNTQGNWACFAYQPTPRCQRIAFGGFSLKLASLSVTNFSAQLLFTSAEVLTQQSTSKGTLTTTSRMDPHNDTVVTDLTWTGDCTTVQLSSWVMSSGGNAGTSQGRHVVSRKATNGTGETPKNVWTAMAQSVSATMTALPRSEGNGFVQIASTFVVCAGNTTRIVTSIVDNIAQGNAYNPEPAAAASASSVDVASLDHQRNAFWAEVWTRSVHFPDYPEITAGWFTSLYISLIGLGKANHAPSGLYGPWVTQDSPAWHGDYTLDYNQEAQFYGVFSTNLAHLAKSYAEPIYNFMPTAKEMAVGQAQKAQISCDAKTLHYTCHIAPWGYMSLDDNVFMHWNGYFAALPLISLWEYTLEVDPRLYGLLDGLNAWSHCFLKNGTSGRLEDINTHNPDEEHEGQKVRNPQIALALMARVAQTQVLLGKELGKEVPEYVGDIVARLAPFNIDRIEKVWSAYEDALATESDDFAMYPVWPSEALQQLDDTTKVIARKSAKRYCNLKTGRPVLVFSAAVRAGSDNEEHAYSRTEIADALELFYKNRGPSGAPTAPGGGTENVGVVAAVNDMLVQAPGAYIELFPVWVAKNASFANLLVKGGVLLSASTTSNVVGNVSLASLPNLPAREITLLNPWSGVDVTVVCGGKTVPVVMVDVPSASGRQGARFTLPGEEGVCEVKNV